MKLPRLERKIIVRAEIEKAAWRPDWKCYCCRDTGYVKRVDFVIPDYKHSHDPAVICQKKGCHAADWVSNSSVQDSFDLRFTSEICQQIHDIEIQCWRETLAAHHEKRKAGLNPEQEVQAAVRDAVIDISRDKSLRKRDRPPEEELQQQRRHEEIRESGDTEKQSTESRYGF
ncbi:MAG: hypothetical protein NVSMB70_02120 [Chamaesiphon sp.]